MQYIDIDNWNRKEHFKFFRRMDYPQFNVCTNINVTNFLKFVRDNKLSFYYAMIYAATQAANDVENLRYRIREDKVILHDKLHPSFTDISDKDDGLFKFVTVDLVGGLFDFVKRADVCSKEQTEYFGYPENARRDDLIYITCIPWVSFTSISHTISLNRDDSVPRISWGKYFMENEKVLLPFSVQANHVFVDGVHIGKYFSAVQNIIDKL